MVEIKPAQGYSRKGLTYVTVQFDVKVLKYFCVKFELVEYGENYNFSFARWSAWRTVQSQSWRLHWQLVGLDVSDALRGGGWKRKSSFFSIWTFSAGNGEVLSSLNIETRFDCFIFVCIVPLDQPKVACSFSTFNGGFQKRCSTFYHSK